MSTRTIPLFLADANEIPDKELRRICSEASALKEEERKISEGDTLLVQWLVEQVNKHGSKRVAELLDYDPANLAKIIAKKRKIPRALRKRIDQQRILKANDILGEWPI